MHAPLENFVARWTGRAFNPLFSSPDNGPKISPAGLAWIAEFETGGEAYYNLRLRKPTWPGGASGVTIGIGYDLGYNTRVQIADDWEAHVSPAVLMDLQDVAGIKGETAEAYLGTVAHVRIPWAEALQVFKRSSVPRFGKLLVQVFPGVELLPVPAQEALLSLVFNRGTSLKGDSRREMAEIRKLVGYYRASTNRPRLLSLIAVEIVKMKRLWIGKGLDGLLKRRDAEAYRVRNALQIEVDLMAAGGFSPMLAA